LKRARIIGFAVCMPIARAAQSPPSVEDLRERAARRLRAHRRSGPAIDP
jgi:hypothetical protein